jgi:hypothetical protein
VTLTVPESSARAYIARAPARPVQATFTAYGGVRSLTSTEKLPSLRVETSRSFTLADESVRVTEAPVTAAFVAATPVTTAPVKLPLPPLPHATSTAEPSTAATSDLLRCLELRPSFIWKPPGSVEVRR